ncbi:MAG: hypothetical protein H0W36_06250 [Gemmatimonadetes bacterium]|nr:hypothetical protein [Gemmatimonadota bacterium]
MGAAGAVSMAALAMLVALAAFGGGGTATAAPTAPPSNTADPKIQGVPEEGETLTGEPGNWKGTDPITYSPQWQRCNASGAACVDIAGATSPTYQLKAEDVGRTIRLRVTATNKDGSATATSRPTGVVKAASAAAPRNTSAPSVAGTATVGQTLTGNEGAWQGTAPFQFAFQWQRCDKDGNACANISGATAKTYRITSADAGHTLRLRVIASNSAGSTTAFSRPSAIVSGGTQPPPPPPPPSGGPAGQIKLPSGETSIPDSSVSLPNRFIISRFRFTPNPLRSRAQTITARFRVTDTRGYVIRNALVFVTPLPYGWTTQPAETLTNTNGWAQVQMRAKQALPRRGAIVMFVRARKHGDNILAGVSSRRLVQMLVSLG